jgi:hypothetical protein
MYEPVQKCTSCGAGLALDDLRAANCRFCGTVLPHRAQAEQHAQLVGNVLNQMIGQQAEIANQWRANFGFGVQPGPPPGAPGSAYSPYADAQRIAAAHIMQATAQAQTISRTITFVVIAVVLGSFVLVAVILAVVMLAS